MALVKEGFFEQFSVRSSAGRVFFSFHRGFSIKPVRPVLKKNGTNATVSLYVLVSVTIFGCFLFSFGLSFSLSENRFWDLKVKAALGVFFKYFFIFGRLEGPFLKETTRI